MERRWRLRFYTRRGGGLGASFGLIGLVIIAPFYLAALMIVGFLLVPFLAIALVSLVAAIGDGLLRVLPGYRRHRREVGPVQWYRTALRASGATVGNLLNWVGGSRQRYSTKAKTGNRSSVSSTSVTSARAISTPPSKAMGVNTTAVAVRAKKRQVASDAFARLTPIEFVQAVHDLFSAKGFGSATVVPGLMPGSHALTMIESDQQKVVVRCESFIPGVTVGVKVLRESIPLIERHGADKLAIVSLNPFTPQAKKLATSSHIALFDSERLINTAEDVGWLQTTEEASMA